MGRRSIEEHNIRNLQKSHNVYYVTIPVNIIRDLRWKERQKLVVERSKNNRITIKDWEEQ